MFWGLPDQARGCQLEVCHHNAQEMWQQVDKKTRGPDFLRKVLAIYLTTL